MLIVDISQDGESYDVNVATTHNVTFIGTFPDQSTAQDAADSYLEEKGVVADVVNIDTEAEAEAEAKARRAFEAASAYLSMASPKYVTNWKALQAEAISAYDIRKNK